MTPERFVEIVESVSFPLLGATLKVEKTDDGVVRVMLRIKSVDVNPPHAEMFINREHFLPPWSLQRCGVDAGRHWIRSLFQGLILHELDEQLRFGGERPFDPHRS